MGQDHLLHIATGIFVEEYKRFYFRDIQSLTIHQSRSGTVANIVLAVLGVGFGALTVAFNDLGRIIAGIITLALVINLMGNFMRGPACVCYIQTAVQKQRLRSISRVKKAQKIMDFLKPTILGSQQESQHEYK
jgi:hypothetical protein